MDEGSSPEGPVPPVAPTQAPALPPLQAPTQAFSQGDLFPELRATPEQGLGYRVPTALSAAGISYRQLDYWARTGLVTPSIRGAAGSGSQRLYSFRDVLVLKVVKKLLDAGVSLQNVRAAVKHLRARGDEELASLTLISDGSTVYECTSNDEVIDLVQGGQAVFAVAIGRTVLEVEGTLAEFPGERADEATHEVVPVAGDELATRRGRRKVAG